MATTDPHTQPGPVQPTLPQAQPLPQAGAPCPQAGYPQGQSVSPPPAGYQYPQAQYPQAQYPQAQYPQAQYPQAQYPQAQYPQAQYPQAQYPQAQAPQAGYQYPQQAAQYPQAQPTAPAPGYQYPAQHPQAVAQHPRAAQPQAVPAGYTRPVAQPQGVARPQPVTQSSAAAKKHQLRGEEEEESEEDLYEKAARSTPPWLISMAIHMLGMIICGLIVVGGVVLNNNIDLTADAEDEVDEELIYAEQLGNQVEIDSPLAIQDDFTVQKPVLAEANLPPVEDPFATPFSETEPTPDGNTAVSDIQANAIGLALDGREAGVKRALLGRYGGNATTEEAVIRGLEWLARQQHNDGSWSLSGPYKGGVEKGLDNPQAATAMALLAFQGHGETHREGRFMKNVAAGWKWLSKEQDADGNFFHEGPFNHRYYTQGQCAIALCEIYGMTKDPQFKEPAELAIKHLIKAQSPEGGWRYSPNADSDVSVTGWIVMALQSARMAKIEVPEDNLRQIERFLDKVAQQDGARYPYQKGLDIKLSMTAEAILCRQYLGWRRSDPRMIDAMNWVTADNNLVSYTRGRDVYCWYYATQAAHHMEGEWWQRWNGVMRQILPEQQIKRGAESGSWDPERPTEDAWARHGGRLYVTCLSIYMLEVYYRHLPIYTKIYTDLLKSGRTPGT